MTPTKEATEVQQAPEQEKDGGCHMLITHEGPDPFQHRDRPKTKNPLDVGGGPVQHFAFAGGMYLELDRAHSSVKLTMCTEEQGAVLRATIDRERLLEFVLWLREHCPLPEPWPVSPETLAWYQERWQASHAYSEAQLRDKQAPTVVVHTYCCICDQCFGSLAHHMKEMHPTIKRGIAA